MKASGTEARGVGASSIVGGTDPSETEPEAEDVSVGRDCGRLSALVVDTNLTFDTWMGVVTRNGTFKVLGWITTLEGTLPADFSVFRFIFGCILGTLSEFTLSFVSDIGIGVIWFITVNVVNLQCLRKRCVEVSISHKDSLK